MSVYRASLFVVAGLFTAAMTSAASAGCCGGWGVQAPIVQTPLVYGSTGCGGCGTPSAAIVYAQPVAPAPAPVIATNWGCGCRRTFVYAATPAIEVTPVQAAPIYIVNQGPDYTGPGIMVPYHTWAPAGGYVGPGAYPYFHGYGPRRAYFGPYRHFGVYHTRFYGRPVWRGYRWHG
jgi:hypothetical protein